jgi:hypothetical protein
MRYVLIKRMPDSAEGDVSFELDQGLTRGKVSNGGVMKRGYRGENGGAWGERFSHCNSVK